MKQLGGGLLLKLATHGFCEPRYNLRLDRLLQHWVRRKPVLLLFLCRIKSPQSPQFPQSLSKDIPRNAV
ncbi:hypothetical protein [Laspinema olomoucense]|uniref:Uncharacterized protein n=1 Tax=Laspinema olomoucense D3b TaxID=2953688 RepID=A0ABT2N829_9CYAN|nr:hypothetical protein [Laspinema sp. D3b]MCT7978631.1 hypothetical protein [Laspinema sp. D3b]